MKKFFTKILALALVIMIIPSCGNPTKMAEQAEQITVQCVPEVLQVMGGYIDARVTVSFPMDFFHPKAIMEVVPALVYNGGEILLDPVMLQGEDVADNYIQVSKTGGSVTRDFEFKYKEGMEQCHLELRASVIHKDKKIEFPAPYKVADGANTTYMLVKQKGELAYAPDAYLSKVPEKNEAQILYLINSYAVRSGELKSQEIKEFQDYLASIKDDERRKVTSTEIVAYASPEGAEAINDKLSKKRAESAQDAFVKTIGKKNVASTPVKSVAVSEDWEGFKELVENSDIADKHLILRVLEMYSDPVVREREIKNMSQVFTTLAKEILPQLRRARFIANIEYTNYSDEELVSLISNNIELLDEEALLHAATLIEDTNKKLNVYFTAAEKYSSDRAKLNLAATYLSVDMPDDAEIVLMGVRDKDDYYYNNTGVIALRKGDYAAAKKAFAKSSLKEAQYNLAILDILDGDYKGAYSKLSGSKTYNEALAAILVDKLPVAASILTKDCPCSSYLKAIVAARSGRVEDAKAALNIASKDEKLAKRAETDIEFAKLR